MKKLVWILILLFVLNSCKEQEKNSLAEGIWLAELEAMDETILPFNFKLIKSADDQFQMEIYNAEEVIAIDEIEIQNDSIFINFQVYEGYVAARFTENTIEGKFIKESLDRIVPFKATYGISERFRNS